MFDDRKSGLTVGKKLYTVFAAMSALILGLICVYQAYGRYSGELLDLCARKLEIGSQTELATTEMQGAQRGLMLSYAMKDPAGANQYISLYGTSSGKITALLARLRPLLTTENERNAAERIARNQAIWQPRFEKLRRLCDSGDISAAYKLRNENKLISAEMRAGATAMVREQNAAAEAVRANSRRLESAIAALAVILSLSLGIAGAGVMRGTNRQLRRSIADLEIGADRVAEAAVRIASSSHEVAQGASEQANSLEQTSVSSREMALLTNRNAENSQQAAAFAHDLSRQVKEAVSTLGGMITSMDEITSSSGRISQIMRVIDEIAFQTRLLALNAAVEAARAGESGAGFAVVAEEVRSLAQRSAQAAQDTAELVENSILLSKQGGTRLSEVAASVQAVTGSAAKVKGLVDQVDSSSRDQAEGIAQISGAVHNIENVTRRTVENARQSSDASEALRQQSERLRVVVSRLRLMVGSGAAHEPASHPGPEWSRTRDSASPDRRSSFGRF